MQENISHFMHSCTGKFFQTCSYLKRNIKQIEVYVIETNLYSDRKVTFRKAILSYLKTLYGTPSVQRLDDKEKNLRR